MKQFPMVFTGVIAGLLISLPGFVDAQLAPVAYRHGRYEYVPHEQIRLDSQRIIIRLNWESYTVDDVYHLVNTGDSTTAWVGVPMIGSEAPYFQHPVWIGFRNYDFMSFDAWVNGRKTEFTEAPGPQPSFAVDYGSLRTRVRHHDKMDWIKVKQVRFPGHAKTTVRIRYEVGYKKGINETYLRYDLLGSRYWKDRIRKSLFLIDSSLVGGTDRIKPLELGDTRDISNDLRMYEVLNHVRGPTACLTISFRRHNRIVEHRWRMRYGK